MRREIMIVLAFATLMFSPVLGKSISGKDEFESIDSSKHQISESHNNTISKFEGYDETAINKQKLENAILEPADLPSEKHAVVIAQKTSVLKGETYEADIVMLNPNSKYKYTIFVNDEEFEGSRCKYKDTCSTVGSHTYKGYILETDEKGRNEQYPFIIEFSVGKKPEVNISTKGGIDVVFCGVFNNIDISVNGIQSNNLDVVFSNIEQEEKTAKGYKIKPLKYNMPCDVTVYTKKDGKKRLIGRKTFRTISLPYPIISLEPNSRKVNFHGGIIEKELLLSLENLSAVAPSIITDLDPDFSNIRYQVRKFDMKFFNSKGEVEILHSNSCKFTDQMIEKIKKIESGTSFYVTNIMVISQDARGHLLPQTIEIIVK